MHNEGGGRVPRPRGAADDAYARQWGSCLGRAWRGCGLDSLRERVPQRLGGRGCGRASWDGRGPVPVVGSAERGEAQVSRGPAGGVASEHDLVGRTLRRVEMFHTSCNFELLTVRVTLLNGRHLLQRRFYAARRKYRYFCKTSGHASWFRSFCKSKVQPPPPRGSVGLSEKSKVQPPLPEG